MGQLGQIDNRTQRFLSSRSPAPDRDDEVISAGLG